MKLRTLFVQMAVLLAGLLLAACTAENRTVSNQAESPPAEPFEDTASDDPEVALQPEGLPVNETLAGFQPTPSPLYEQSYRANPLSDRDYSQYEVVTLLPQDAIPALSFPPIYKAERAEREYLPDELVIGVEFNGDARAYPIEMLSRHEIVNDTVGGIHLAVTW